MKWAIGIDIGGTKTNIGCIDQEGTILHKRKIPTDLSLGFKAIVDEIVREVKKLSHGEKPPEGIGVGIAGQIDAQTGSVFFAPNLHWQNVPLQKELEEALHYPVKVTNDVRAATLGEWLHGAGKGAKNLVCLFIGTGIGGGVICEGQLLSGANNSAAELGHMTIDLHGQPCSCGSLGCFEAIGGGWAIARRAEELMPATVLEKEFGHKKPLTAKEVIEAYRRGNTFAIKVIEDAREAYIFGCKSIVNAFNPERLIIGGGIYHGLPEMIEWIREGVCEQAFRAASEKLEIIPGDLKNDAGMVGAASMMFF
jgi:glucokinase